MNPLKITLSLLSAFGLLAIATVGFKNFTHKYTVIRVLDGDTFETRDVWGKTIRVRLAGIDAPESAQAYGPEAKALLTEAIGDTFTYECKSHDKYGRMIARIRSRGRDVGAMMLWEGAAHTYMTDDHRYHNAAEQAKRQNKGLWAQPNVIQPSDWRKSH